MSDYLAKHQDSLIEREQQQMQLFSSADMGGDLFSENEARGVFTGERLFANDPERYRIIVSLLAEGLPMRQIAKLTRTSLNTIMAVRDREPAIIEAEKKMIGRKMRGAVRLLVDKVIESIEHNVIEVTDARALQSLLVGTGILVDKSELLLGGVTQRIAEVDESAPRVGTLDDLWDRLERAPADPSVIDVEDAQGTGLRGGERPAKRSGSEPCSGDM